MAATAVPLRLRDAPAVAMGLAIFDLDRTVIEGSSLAAFGRAAVAERLVPRRLVTRHLLAELRFKHRGLGGETLARLTANLLAASAGLPYEQLADLATRRAPAIAARAFPAARARLDRHRDDGLRTVLLSASPEPLVAEIATVLGFDVAIGTPIEVRDGRLTGRLAGRLCHGDGKVARLRDVLGEVDLATCVAYGDAESDLPLLRAVGAPHAVNADRRLGAVARAAGWPMLQFA